LLRKANVLRYHDSSGAQRRSTSDALPSDFLENTTARSLIHTAQTFSLLSSTSTAHHPPPPSSTQRHFSPSLSSPLDTSTSSSAGGGGNSTGGGSVFSVGLQEVFKASTTFSKLVSNSLFQFGSDTSAAKPLTYFESHRDDHEIANYHDEEEGEEGEDSQEGKEEELGNEAALNEIKDDGKHHPLQIDRESVVLDWQNDNPQPVVTMMKPTPPLSVPKSTTIVPLIRLKGNLQSGSVAGDDPVSYHDHDIKTEGRERRTQQSYGNEDENENGSFDEKDN
jgi:hypothetical protein